MTQPNPISVVRFCGKKYGLAGIKCEAVRGHSGTHVRILRWVA